MMELLLDTHVFLWWKANDGRLSKKTKDSIADAGRVFVSAATAWEACIKASLGKLRLTQSVESGVVEAGFEKLAISFAHAESAAALPKHHSDPFDRMLIAQAQLEGLALVTHDPQFRPYAVSIIWA